MLLFFNTDGYILNVLQESKNILGIWQALHPCISKCNISSFLA